ncbi:MAG TPA: SDR family oxidoreductase [Oligoflexia bacterium]|nr:SDR family oxidoreductase [Oligoflexia bacterium]HMR24270.1 SDR family oxidoreductase [Oligoflexia bacterium]
MNTTLLKDKVLIVSGASRGIGKAIALRMAKAGMRVVILGKTENPHPKVPGTIHETVADIEKEGGQALAVACDVRDTEQLASAVEKTLKTFGQLDMVVNNAGAIQLQTLDQLESKRIDLMTQINAYAPIHLIKFALPYLKNSEHAHILNICPPIDLDLKWFAKHSIYTVSKYSQSMLTLGLSEEFKKDAIAVNGLWPKTLVATAAVQNLLGGDQMIQRSRKTDIVADAAHWIFCQSPEKTTGNLFLDENVLSKAGISNLDQYAINPDMGLQNDLYVS